MQTLQRVLSKIVQADSAKIIIKDCACRLCKEYYLRLYMQSLQRVISKIVHADSAKSII